MHCVQFKKLKSFLKTTFLANKSQVLLNIKSCNCEKLLHFIHTINTFELNIFGKMGKKFKMLLLSIFGVTEKTPYLEGIIFCT